MACVCSGARQSTAKREIRRKAALGERLQAIAEGKLDGVDGNANSKSKAERRRQREAARAVAGLAVAGESGTAQHGQKEAEEQKKVEE